MHNSTGLCVLYIEICKDLCLAQEVILLGHGSTVLLMNCLHKCNSRNLFVGPSKIPFLLLSL